MGDCAELEPRYPGNRESKYNTRQTEMKPAIKGEAKRGERPKYNPQREKGHTRTCVHGFITCIGAGCWEDVCSCISDDLLFVRKPPFTAIPIRGRLIQVRHQI